MTAFVTLSCPSCGSKLQVTNDLDRFACGACGNEHVVRRTGGIVSLAPVVEGLLEVKISVDKTASELAIPRLEKEIGQLNSEFSHGLELEKSRMKNRRLLRGDFSRMFVADYFARVKRQSGLFFVLDRAIDGLSIDDMGEMFHYSEQDSNNTYRFGARTAFNDFREHLRHLVGLKNKIIEKLDELEKHRQVVQM